MSVTQGLMKLIPAGQQGIDPGESLVMLKTVAFTTTLTQVSVVVYPLASIQHVSIQQVAAAADADDAPIVTDGAIGATNHDITITRPASGATGLILSLLIVGKV
jgi:hypothetical protein